MSEMSEAKKHTYRMTREGEALEVITDYLQVLRDILDKLEGPGQFADMALQRTENAIRTWEGVAPMAAKLGRDALVPFKQRMGVKS